MYFIRIQEYFGYAKHIKELFSDTKTFREVVAVKHTGKSRDNPHFHISVKTHLKRPALRARLVKVFSLGKGNQHMSIKPIQEGEYENTIQYMFHEEDRDTFEILLGNEEVCEIGRIGARQFKARCKETGESSRVVKQREPTFTEKVVDACIERFKCGDLFREGFTKQDVLEYIITFFGKNKKVFDKFIILRIFNVVQYHLYGKEFVGQMAAEVMMV